jgi:multiple sugar transport system substrate-binding protein
MAVGESWREHAPPATWDEVLAWAGKWPTALSLAGPHAALTFMSICVALGEPPASEDPNVFVSAVTGSTALSIMDRLARPSAAWTRTLNPIGLLEAMASGAELSLVPLVYGYVNYAASGPNGRKRVTFHDAPAARRGGRPGTTLGGTGLAVTRRCKVTPALIDHLRWLMSDGVQERFIPDHDGQPSRRSAWRDADVNRAWGNFYRNTERTLEAAWVRPRHRGYIAFQATASAMIREWLEAAPSSPGALLVRLQSAYAESRRGAGGI